MTKELPDVLNRGDVVGVIYNKPSWFSRAIIKHQRDEEKIADYLWRISHVLIVTNPRDFIGYEECYPKGGRVKILDKYKDCSLVVYRYIFDNQEDRLKLTYDIVDDIVCNSNAKYNVWGILGFALNMKATAEDMYFCSQVIAKGFREYGYELIKNLPDDKISPGRLCSSTELSHVVTIKNSNDGELSLDYASPQR